MDTTLVNKSYILHAGATGGVQAEVSVGCSSDEELLFLMQYLNDFNLPAEFAASEANKEKQIEAAPESEKPKLRLQRDVYKELEAFKKENATPIADLEID